MTTARSRLVALAAAAGYPPGLLTQIAAVTLPGYRPGDQLNQPDIQTVTDAVQVIAQAGYSAQQLTDVLGEHQARHPDRWRQVFWQHTTRIAAVRYQHPGIYGLSPCDTGAGPDRLARSLRRSAPTA